MDELWINDVMNIQTISELRLTPAILLWQGLMGFTLAEQEGSSTHHGGTNMWNPIPSAYTNSAAWADIDGDGDLDVFLGRTKPAEGIPEGVACMDEIWTNDGVLSPSMTEMRRPAPPAHM